MKRLVAETTAQRHRPAPALAVAAFWKRGEGAGSGWRKRWFALLPGDPAPTLRYFANEDAWRVFRDTGGDTARGVVDLDAVEALRRVVVARGGSAAPASAPPRAAAAAADGAGDAENRAVFDALPPLAVAEGARRASVFGRPSSPSGGAETRAGDAAPTRTLRLALVTPTRTWHLRFASDRDLHRWAALLAPHCAPAARPTDDAEERADV